VWLTGPAESKGNLQVELRYACVAPTVHSVILVFIFVKDKLIQLRRARGNIGPVLRLSSPTIYCIKTTVLSNLETAKRGNHDSDFLMIVEATRRKLRDN
jgi:hypothetical protein